MESGNAGLQAVRTIALVELNRLGDLVHALAAARVFKQHLPDAAISMLVDRKYAGLAELESAVDHVTGYADTQRLSGLLAAAFAVRRTRFDCICSLSPIGRNAVVTRLGCTRYAVGYLDVGPRRPIFLRRSRVSSIGIGLARGENYGFEHIALTAMKVCRSLGFDGHPGKFDPRALGPAPREFLDEQFFVFHPLAGWRFREWPEENATEFLRKIVQRSSCRVVVVGSSDEEARLRRIVGASGVHQDRASVQTGLAMDALTNLLARALVFIGTDSGPYQLAVTMGVPTVGLLGPAPPEITGSKNRGDRILYHKLECSPCRQHRCVRPDNACLKLISADEAVREVCILLDAVSGGGNKR
jgi:ADP-heptose:LPS heptosyltransferase